MNNKDKLLLVGKVVGIHGIHGEIKILPYGDCDKKPWKEIYLFRGEHALICEVTDNRPHKGVILASIKGYKDRNRAGELAGYDVFVEKASLPMLPEGEYYHFQLEGMEVITDEGKKIGVATSVLLTGSNDVYVVKDSLGKEFLIPATADVIQKIDVDTGKIVIHLIEGLLPEKNEI
ncbi:MAG TPA: ribosome maturation factor RimM [Thermodesulfobacteriota bacterium]|nr:ribosome maturation factor RimM [Thermodesulfobacteriota bacterium]